MVIDCLKTHLFKTNALFEKSNYFFFKYTCKSQIRWAYTIFSIPSNIQPMIFSIWCTTLHVCLLSMMKPNLIMPNFWNYLNYIVSHFCEYWRFRTERPKTKRFKTKNQIFAITHTHSHIVSLFTNSTDNVFSG